MTKQWPINIFNGPKRSPLAPGAITSCKILSLKWCPGRRVIEDFSQPPTVCSEYSHPHGKSLPDPESSVLWMKENVAVSFASGPHHGSPGVLLQPSVCLRPWCWSQLVGPIPSNGIDKAVVARTTRGLTCHLFLNRTSMKYGNNFHLSLVRTASQIRVW